MNDADAVPLKPCPFCGSTATTIGYYGQPARKIYAECTSCGATGPSHDYALGDVAIDLDESWNCRAPASDQADAVLASKPAAPARAEPVMIYQRRYNARAAKWQDCTETEAFDCRNDCHWEVRMLYAAPIPASSVVRVEVMDELRADISADRNFIAGMKLGWNFRDSNDEDGFQKCIEGRYKQISEALASKQINEREPALWISPVILQALYEQRVPGRAGPVWPWPTEYATIPLVIAAQSTAGGERE